MKLSTFIFYFFIFVIIYITDDSLLFGTINNIGFVLFKIMIYCFLIVFLAIRNSKYTFFSLAILISLIFLIFFTALFQQDFTNGYMYQVLVLLLAFLLTKEIDFQAFKFIFVKIIYILSIISLMIYATVNFVPSVLTLFPIMTNFEGIKIYNLFLSIIYEIDGSLLLRNTSIYREPGVFMIYINIAILFILFTKSNFEKKYIIIFFLAIISTMSTAGVIIFLTMILASFLNKSNTNLSQYKYPLIITVILFISILLNSDFIQDKIFGKLNPSSNSYGSTLARTTSFIVPVKIFLDYPIFGSGLETFSKEFTEYSISLFGIPFTSGGTATNTFTNKFATYGLLFGSIFVYSIIRFSKFLSEQNGTFTRVAIILVLFAMFSNEDLRYSLLFNMIFFYGVSLKSISNNSLKTSTKNMKT